MAKDGETPFYMLVTWCLHYWKQGRVGDRDKICSRYMVQHKHWYTDLLIIVYDTLFDVKFL
jgi:hypothetical protein